MMLCSIAAQDDWLHYFCPCGVSLQPSAQTPEAVAGEGYPASSFRPQWPYMPFVSQWFAGRAGHVLIPSGNLT